MNFRRPPRWPLFGTLVLLTPLFLGCSQGPMGMNWLSSQAGTTSLVSLNNAYLPQAVTILQNSCVQCHTANSGPSNVYGLTDVNHLVSSGLVVPGAPGQSPLYQAIAGGTMPPSSPMSSNDQALLNQWISGGQ